MKLSQRWFFLFLLLLLTLSAVVYVSGENSTPPEVVSAATKDEYYSHAETAGKYHNKNSALLLHKRPKKNIQTSKLKNPFSVKSWYVPPVVVSKPVAEKPKAPPLPFTYVGKLEESKNQWVVYLARGSQTFLVKKGETFAGSYRLEGIENGNLVIQYLPIPTRQALPIGNNL